MVFLYMSLTGNKLSISKICVSGFILIEYYLDAKISGKGVKEVKYIYKGKSGLTTL